MPEGRGVMAKASYEYYGYILPKSFDGIGSIRKPIDKFDASGNLLLRISLEFKKSDFRAKTEIHDTRIDIPTGRNAVQEVVYDIVDSWGFRLAIGCTVVISHGICQATGERTNFGPTNSGLREHIDKFESDLSASEIAAVLRHKKGFYLTFAVRDIANSHRYLVKDLPFYCRRATESCMRFMLDINDIDPDFQKNEPDGWQFLQDAAGIGKGEYLKIKRMGADKIRHGSNVEFSAENATEMARVAWESVHACLAIGRDRFVDRDNDSTN